MPLSHAIAAAVVSAHFAAQPIPLPAPTGPSAVGLISLSWTDPARPDLFSDDPDDLRPMAVEVFHPAEAAPSGAPAAYADDLITAIEQAGEQTDPRRAQIAQSILRQRDVAMSAHRDAPAADGPHPLALISPGGNVSRHWHTALAQDLASHGWIVAVMGHFESTLDFFPGAGLRDSNSRWRDLPEDVDNELSDMLAADARATLDRLLRMSGAAEGPLAGRIDPARIAIIGHSRGGKTVARACSTDQRFRAAIVMDNFAPPRERETGLAVPQLTMRTDEPRRWSAEAVSELDRYLAANTSAAYSVVINGAGHMSFTDIAIIEPERAAATVDGPAAHAAICALSRAFLDEFLLQKDAGAFEAAAAKIEAVQSQRVSK